MPRLGEATIDLRVLGFTLLVSMATGFVFSLGPAISLSRTNLAHVLKEGGSAVSAGLGEAKTIGALSVPPAWTYETTMIRPLAVALPAASAGAAAEASAGSAGSGTASVESASSRRE